MSRKRKKEFPAKMMQLLKQVKKMARKMYKSKMRRLLSSLLVRKHDPSGDLQKFTTQHYSERLEITLANELSAHAFVFVIMLLA
jgi:hypothetical protein